MSTTKVLVPSGVLGLGFELEALMHGIKNKPDIISIDGGSTDSGPASLGSGTSKYSRAAIKSEWKTLMKARKEVNIPLIIGSCGTCGTNSMVDWMEEITIELAKEFNSNDWDKLAIHPEYKTYTPYIMLRHLLMHDHNHLYKIEDMGFGIGHTPR